MSKYTPGPWKVDHDFICCLPDGKDGDWLIIARMPALADMIDHRNDGLAWQSNAKLIASAPEMYQLIRILSDVTCNAVPPAEFGEIRKRCWAVMDKVEGKS